jgi:hypothetical protein
VDFAAAIEAGIFRGWFNVRTLNLEISSPAVARNLSALLRAVLFISQPSPGRRPVVL